MKLKIDLKESSTPLEFTDVKNSYTKGPLFCIYSDNTVTKIPIQNIWRIVEDYVSANTDEVKDKPGKPAGQPSAEFFRDKREKPTPTQSEAAIKELIEITDWDDICIENLSEDFIREFQDRVDWFKVSAHSTLSEDFIREFQDRVDWFSVSENSTLSEDFIREFQDRVDWEAVDYYQDLSDEFRKEFNDRI